MTPAPPSLAMAPRPQAPPLVAPLLPTPSASAVLRPRPCCAAPSSSAPPPHHCRLPSPSLTEPRSVDLLRQLRHAALLPLLRRLLCPPTPCVARHGYCRASASPLYSRGFASSVTADAAPLHHLHGPGRMLLLPGPMPPPLLRAQHPCRHLLSRPAAPPRTPCLQAAAFRCSWFLSAIWTPSLFCCQVPA